MAPNWPPTGPQLATNWLHLAPSGPQLAPKWPPLCTAEGSERASFVEAASIGRPGMVMGLVLVMVMGLVMGLVMVLAPCP